MKTEIELLKEIQRTLMETCLSDAAFLPCYCALYEDMSILEENEVAEYMCNREFFYWELKSKPSSKNNIHIPVLKLLLFLFRFLIVIDELDATKFKLYQYNIDVGLDSMILIGRYTEIELISYVLHQRLAIEDKQFLK